jgi:hypothetical protein
MDLLRTDISQTVSIVTAERAPYVVLDQGFVLPDTDRRNNWAQPTADPDGQRQGGITLGARVASH